jgi:hypothetical protein
VKSASVLAVSAMSTIRDICVLRVLFAAPFARTRVVAMAIVPETTLAAGAAVTRTARN